jgi:hypothetical protein
VNHDELPDQVGGDNLIVRLSVAYLYGMPKRSASSCLTYLHVEALLTVAGAEERDDGRWHRSAAAPEAC